MVLELDDLTRPRLDKLTRLEQAGIEVYPHRYRRTHLAAEAAAGVDRLHGQTTKLAGRLMSLRGHGKLTFGHLADSSGAIQLSFRHNILGEEGYAFLKYLDLGDVIGVEGQLYRTKTAEVTLEVRGITLLAKALRPLPEKWHGLTDVEKRYRQRYLDLVVNPQVRKNMVTRSRVLRAVRGFLDSRGFVEVETPVLQPLYGGAAARPFETEYHALERKYYLRIATELYLKRLIVGGMEKVYEIGKDFRNEGISTKHNPEFTMLESYEAYADYNDVMTMIEELVSSVAGEVLGRTSIEYQGTAITLAPPWKRITLREAIKLYSGIDYAQYPDQKSLYEAVRRRRTAGDDVDPAWNRAKLIDEMLSTFVEPNLVQPTFILDYPVELSPFAKKKPGSEETVERFEAFIGGMEVANAFSELNDPRDQYERFLQQRAAREAGDELAESLDEDFLIALEHGMPPTGGLGLGMDRLVMVLTDQPSIRDVILFPQLRTK